MGTLVYLSVSMRIFVKYGRGWGGEIRTLDVVSTSPPIRSDSRDEQLPRMCALAFLSHLDTSRPTHAHLMETLVLRLLSKVCVGGALRGPWGP